MAFKGDLDTYRGDDDVSAEAESSPARSSARVRRRFVIMPERVSRDFTLLPDVRIEEVQVPPLRETPDDLAAA